MGMPIEGKVLESLLKQGKAVKAEGALLPVGAVVRLLRLELGMKQRQLADRAKVPISTISRIEKGAMRPTDEMLRKIFGAMECDVAIVPVPRFESLQSLLREKAKKLAEKRVRYIEGTMALEQQRPEKKWRERLIESEIEALLKSPTQLWEEDAY